MSRSLWLSVCLVGLFSYPAQAQAIHGHPQKAAYASPLEYPTVSAQEHWRVNAGRVTPDNTCALASADDLTCAHVHNDLTCPMYAELGAGAIVTCGISITLHHLPGRVYEADYSFYHVDTVTSVVWDATGTSTLPAMIGDPVGDKTFTAHVTLTLPPSIKDWWSIGSEVRFSFTNGSSGLNTLLVPIWSTQTPVNPISYHLPALRAGSNFGSAVHPEVVWGQLTVEYDALLPIAPITQPWNTLVAFYSYGRPTLISGTDQIRYDMDLHHEIPGRIEFDVTQADDLGMPWTFDPTVLGAGTHKVAALRVQPDGAEQLSTVLVVSVTVGTTGPPVDMVCGPWVLVSTSTSTSPITTVGNLQSKTDSLNNLYQRTILTQSANGGAACPVN